jgi:hypothetical protein
MADAITRLTGPARRACVAGDSGGFMPTSRGREDGVGRAAQDADAPQGRLTGLGLELQSPRRPALAFHLGQRDFLLV